MAVLIGVQALVLAGLGLLLDLDLWPSDDPAVLMPALTVAYAWPALVLFTVEPGKVRRAFAFASGCAGVLALLAAYVGWQATPVDAFNVEALQAVYVITLLATGFVALAYLRPIVAGDPIRFDALFAEAWRNLLVAGLAAALLGGSAILLVLCAALFATLGIDALADTFEQPWFVLPVAAIVFGTGVLVFRPRQGLIDNIVALVENLARYLLPLVLAIIVAFLLTLPFVSLQALWDTGNGSLILIALNAIAVVLAIVAYAPQAPPPYPRIVHLPVTLILALLPVVSALALLGIGIRVDQYGWSVTRAWAFTGAAVLALFSIGYAWTAIWQRSEWPRGIAPVYVAMGWVMLGILLLVNTPVLDFRAISTRSQMARVDAGEIQANEFDFAYAREMLARPGYLAAQRLIEQLGFDPLAASAGAIMEGPELAAMRDAFWQELYYRDGPFAVPDGVRAAIDREIARTAHMEHPVLVRMELDGDATRTEYLLLSVQRFGDRPARVHYGPEARAVVDLGQGWEVHGMGGSRSGSPLPDDAEPIVQELREGEIELVPRRYDDLRIGNTLFFPANVWEADEAGP